MMDVSVPDRLFIQETEEQTWAKNTENANESA